MLFRAHSIGKKLEEIEMRQIILDTETTGLDPQQGHRVIEIGCVEVIDRRRTGRSYHQYIQPDRKIDDDAMEVHGITNEFLVDKPRFTDIAQEFLDFVVGAELVIHNAPFDVGFLNHELNLLGKSTSPIDKQCEILDTLVLARRLHPRQRNSLDALCKRYAIDNSQRELHGALLDAEILSDVYLAMTGGQTMLSLVSQEEINDSDGQHYQLDQNRDRVKVICADTQELEAHNNRLLTINELSGGACLWLKGKSAV